MRALPRPAPPPSSGTWRRTVNVYGRTGLLVSGTVEEHTRAKAPTACEPDSGVVSRPPSGRTSKRRLPEDTHTSYSPPKVSSITCSDYTPKAKGLLRDLKAFVYTGDTVRDFKAHFGIGALPHTAQRRNATLCSLAVHLLRALNRAALKRERRTRGIDLIETIDRVAGGWTGKYRLSERERRLVDQLARRGWDIVRHCEVTTVSGAGA